MNFLYNIWIIFQVLIGFNLVFPALLYIFWKIFGSARYKKVHVEKVLDYGIIVTAYQYIENLPSVVQSLLKLNYDSFTIYIVADNCDISSLSFDDPRVILLRPEQILASNTASHLYAINSFKKAHDIITIIDSDNLVDPEYLNQMSNSFHSGFEAVQGLRAAKNLDGTIACLDAARDMYYHFYDGKILFESGSSATLSGSGMSFTRQLYADFLNSHQIKGAGFDKVLQAWLVGNNRTIAFNEHAIVYDEKTSRSQQLVNQRSRWINTWFKYFKFGFLILFKGIRNLSLNQFIFGIILLRPPLFLFLMASILCLFINLLFGHISLVISWIFAVIVFVLFFMVALWSSETDKRIYSSLKSIPIFIFYQFKSLWNARRANKISVSTEHYQERSADEN